MHNMLYVPSMKNNLLNLGQVLEKGFTMAMQGNHIEIFDDKQKLVLKAPLSRNRTFKVNLSIAAIQCLSTVNTEEDNWLWHYRYGHLNFKSLHQLSSKQMVLGMSSIHSPQKTCEGCLIDKQPRKAFKTKAPQRAKQPLGIVHLDVCRPFDTPSLSGNRYFLTFVDEFTKKIWIYMLKEKGAVFSLFVKFFKSVNRQSELKLKILRIDGGGEYNSKEFKEFCEAKGIEHEVIAPYTPQHNGLAKRRNRTLLDMARCMLKGKGLLNCYWGEAVTTAAYVLNRCPTKRLQSITLEEAWIGDKPMVNHLRIFGSLSYRHIPNERRKKLDDKSEALILVGYHPTSAYKLYSPLK